MAKINKDLNNVSEKVKELYTVVNELSRMFPGSNFTLDGHLVGSIGEVVSASWYGLILLKASAQNHDAISSCGKKVQIKATQVNRVSLYSELEHLIVLKISSDGKFEELYNGPGKPVWEHVGKEQKNGQRSITIVKLKELMKNVSSEDRLIRKVN